MLNLNSSSDLSQGTSRFAALGIIACNEEEAICPALESVFAQSIFSELKARNFLLEITIIANGCTDRTVPIATEFLDCQRQQHPERDAFCSQLLDVTLRSKLNAWNLFTHRYSAREAEFLIFMDADILLHHPGTLWNLIASLENNEKASVSTDQPIKDIAFKTKKSLRERISLGTSRMTQTSEAQMTGQLYCIRAAVARNIFLPRDLPACEDGFIKSLVCTYFLTRDLCTERVIQASGASHIFEAYTSLSDILKNQKRQMIGQTAVHVLVDDYLRDLPLEDKLNLAETLQKLDEQQPGWLKALIVAHLGKVKYFWRLFPNLLTFRFKRLSRLSLAKRLLHLPAALLGFFITLFSCWSAWRMMRRGALNYWPEKKTQLANFSHERRKSLAIKTPA
jgi:glycosyltransferase involved in cell wall biosynthesis